MESIMSRRYCSQECHEKDWKNHKELFLQALRVPLAFKRASSKGVPGIRKRSGGYVYV